MTFKRDVKFDTLAREGVLKMSLLVFETFWGFVGV